MGGWTVFFRSRVVDADLNDYSPPLRKVLVVLKPELRPLALYLIQGDKLPADMPPLPAAGVSRVMRMVQQSDFYRRKDVRRRFMALNKKEETGNLQARGIQEMSEIDAADVLFKSYLDMLDALGDSFQHPEAECRSGKNVLLSKKLHKAFFAGRGEKDTPAKEVCYRCPVRLACFQFGLRQDYGVWGGMSKRQRRSLFSLNGYPAIAFAAEIAKIDIKNKKQIAEYLKDLETEKEDD